MALDFLQVRQEIEALANNAPDRAEKLKNKQEEALDRLNQYAGELEYLRDKAQRANQLVPHYHVALPLTEPLNSSFPLPETLPGVLIIAADGSQINPDRHLGTDYCLVNIGTIQMRPDSGLAPETNIESRLYYGEEIFSMQEETVALMRDVREREILAELAERRAGPVITLADGPIELFVRSRVQSREEAYKKRYFEALKRLRQREAITAGYVDRPRTALLTHLLEIAPREIQPKDANDQTALSGLLDTDVLGEVIKPGERSSIFGMLTRSSREYRDDFVLHFFYLNVSTRVDKPILAKVDLPAWVAAVPEMVDALHAALVSQCLIMQSSRHPYVLTRADEIAVVSLKDREKVTEMISQALLSRGQDVIGKSPKQQGKDAAR